MAVTHIVMFGFRKEVGAQAIDQVIRDMLALKEKCIHPNTNKPYITSSSGGKDNSPEGLQRGIKYAFVVHFDSEQDRDYYVEKDPAHQAFIASVKPVVETVQVIDFTPGAF